MRQNGKNGKENWVIYIHKQGPKEDVMEFLQRLTLVVNRMTPNSEARQIIIQSLAFENGSIYTEE